MGRGGVSQKTVGNGRNELEGGGIEKRKGNDVGKVSGERGRVDGYGKGKGLCGDRARSQGRGWEIVRS